MHNEFKLTRGFPVEHLPKYTDLYKEENELIAKYYNQRLNNNSPLVGLALPETTYGPFEVKIK